MNKVIILGRLTRDIELTHTQNGLPIAKSAIATSRKYKTQTGEQKEEVCFIDITFMGRLAEVANQYLSKGKQVLTEGRLVFNQWTDQNGQKRSKHSVFVTNMQMLGGDNQNSQAQTQPQPQRATANQRRVTQQPQQQNNPYQAAHSEPYVPDVTDEEIPF